MHDCRQRVLPPRGRVVAKSRFLLLGGIVANTLQGKSPAATLVDRRIAERLANIADVDLKQFGLEILRAGDDFALKPADFRWNRDRKVFCIRGQSLAVLQLETTSLARIPAERLDQLARQAREDHEASGRLLTLLMLTDVLLCQSWIYACERQTVRGLVRAALPGSEPREGWLHPLGVVSRSGQVVPRLLHSLLPDGEPTRGSTARRP